MEIPISRGRGRIEGRNKEDRISKYVAQNPARTYDRIRGSWSKLRYGENSCACLLFLVFVCPGCLHRCLRPCRDADAVIRSILWSTP